MNEANKLAAEYHTKIDSYKRKFCTGSFYGHPSPATIEEEKRLDRYIYRVFREIKRKSLIKKVPHNDLNKAVIEFNNKKYR